VLRYALLALLSRRSLTGYELTKRFYGSVAFCWHAHQSQIYADLADSPRDGHALRRPSGIPLLLDVHQRRAAVMDYARLARQTVPGLLLERARRTPARVAYRAKRLGVYRETTWRELADRVAAVALALRARGLRAGETVAIMGSDCPEWTIAALAVQAAGGITYGIYPTSSPSEVAFLLQHGGARFLIAENQEHLDSCSRRVVGMSGAPGGLRDRHASAVHVSR
jgi:non-ribosomal peptide synthetase component F